MSVWKFRDPIYNMNIALLRCSPREAEDFLTKEFGQPSNSEWHSAKTLFVSTPERTAVILWFRPEVTVTDFDDLAMIAHECLHGTSFTLHYAGLKFEEPSEEAFAYHQSWLMREVLARLNEKRKKRAA